MSNIIAFLLERSGTAITVGIALAAGTAALVFVSGQSHTDLSNNITSLHSEVSSVAKSVYKQTVDTDKVTEILEDNYIDSMDGDEIVGIEHQNACNDGNGSVKRSLCPEYGEVLDNYVRFQIREFTNGTENDDILSFEGTDLPADISGGSDNNETPGIETCILDGAEEFWVCKFTFLRTGKENTYLDPHGD